MTKAVFRRYSTKEIYNQQKEFGNIPDGAIFFILDTKQVGVRKLDEYIVVSAENAEERLTILESLVEQIQSNVTVLNEEFEQFKTDIAQDLNNLHTDVNNEILPKFNKLNEELGFVNGEYQPINEDLTNKTVSSAIDFLSDKEKETSNNIVTINNRITTVEEDIVNVKEDISLLQGDEGALGGITNRVSALETNYVTLEPRVAALEIELEGQNSKLETRIRKNA